MVILTEHDKRNIANMHPEDTQYAQFPGTMSEKQMSEWMAKK